MSIAERIRKCAEIAGSGDELARKADIPRRTLETYLSGEADPKAARIAAICQATGVNGHWLLTGAGSEMFDEAVTHGAQGDINLFAESMEVIDLYLEKSRKTMSPANKRKAVEALYKLSIEKNRIDPAVIEIITRLAA